MKYLIGIDVGTTGTKALLFTEKGKMVNTAYRGYGVYSDRPGLAEQDADDWYQAAAATVRECVSILEDPAMVAAVAVSAQGGTMVSVDQEGIPVRRAVSWLDRRAGMEAQELCRGKEEHYYYKTTGWRLNDGYNLAQMKWMQLHEKELFDRTARFLSPLDYLNLRMTGRAVSDFTNEGITNLENLHTWDWDEAVFRDLPVTREQLPELKSAGTVIGGLTSRAALDLGLPAETLVVNGGYDQYCAALGLLAIRKGDLMLSTGTAWVLMAVTDRLVFDTASFLSPCMHIVPGRFGVMSSLETGGISMDWFKNKVASGGGYQETYEEIDRNVRRREPGADELLFYPHFAGTTCPVWSKSSRGAFLGLTLFHDRYHMARAVMEGVVYEICGILDAYRNQDMEIRRIKLVGGASKSEFWTQLIADITQVPVEVYGNADAAGIGAAVIAARGAGFYEDFETAAAAFCQEAKLVLPDASHRQEYERARARYQRGFEHLRRFYDGPESDGR